MILLRIIGIDNGLKINGDTEFLGDWPRLRLVHLRLTIGPYHAGRNPGRGS
jgi:hypothetical protein